MTAVADDRAEVLGRRIGAALIDLVVLFALFLVLALLIGESDAGNGGVRVSLHGGPALIWLALSLVYYFAAEAITGRTLGKRLLGLQVAAVDGGGIGVRRIAVRTVFRLIDGIGFYLIGLIVLLATGRRRQRLGDLAARTIVVPR